MRKIMSVIASTDLHNENDEVLFDRKTFLKAQEIDIEDLDYESVSNSEDENRFK